MIDIKQDGKIVEIHAADVTGIEYSHADGYGSLAQEFVDQGAPKSGQLRELLITLADGSMIAITMMNKIKAPDVHRNPNLDVEKVIASARGTPLPTAQDVAEKFVPMIERDLTGKTSH